MYIYVYFCVAVATPSADETTYSNVNYSKTQRPGSKQPAASNRRSGVTSERVALLVLSVLLAAAVTALGVTHEACPRCEDGWEPHGGKCYFFSLFTSSWNQSRRQCRSMRGDLVVINNREEQEFLVSRLMEKMDNPEDKFWIGLTDSKKEDEWLWVDNTRLDPRLKFWRDGEPDNWTGSKSDGEDYPDGEDCVRMGVEYLQSWSDKSCESPQKSICEKPEEACP
ncbi:hepatic lectin-like isoform X3 [Hippoglossus stenolepis]|uniref:hepatic lectin-like isoform X3 n=1 Tax=Hippoglossus stenolepis TaxID=195615 RepID=UPI001FAFB7D8|nr:hepatic lectin-like isoform X3 [Hippoglossus stenolepis]